MFEFISSFENTYCNLDILFVLYMGKQLKNMWMLSNGMVGIIILFICGFARFCLKINFKNI